MSSEKRQRSVMKNDLEPVQITAQSVPFAFTTRQYYQNQRQCNNYYYYRITSYYITIGKVHHSTQKNSDERI